MHAQAHARVSYTDYLAALEASEVKLEFIDGIVRAMGGGTIEHARLAGSFAFALATALAGKRCVVLPGDAKIRIEASNRATFPDVSVVCGKIERSPIDAEAITNPIVIVEVLSDSTEAYDRGEKSRHYRKLPSLREYEVWRRHGDVWQIAEHGPAEDVELPSIDVRLPVDVIYASPL
jgi:Uma2 family endonuclease